MNTLRIALLYACVGTSIIGHPSFATEQDTLKGIVGIGVVVENIRPDIEKNIVTKAELKLDTEL